MRNNETALAEIELAPKVLAGAPTRDQRVELFGVKLPLAGRHRPDRAWPACCGRTPNSPRRARRRGSERSTARATLDRDHRGDGAATPGPKWMQVFLYKDRGLTAEFAGRPPPPAIRGSSSPSTTR